MEVPADGVDTIHIVCPIPWDLAIAAKSKMIPSEAHWTLQVGPVRVFLSYWYGQHYLFFFFTSAALLGRRNDDPPRRGEFGFLERKLWAQVSHLGRPLTRFIQRHHWIRRLDICFDWDSASSDALFTEIERVSGFSTGSGFRYGGCERTAYSRDFSQMKGCPERSWIVYQKSQTGLEIRAEERIRAPTVRGKRIQIQDLHAVWPALVDSSRRSFRMHFPFAHHSDARTRFLRYRTSRATKGISAKDEDRLAMYSRFAIAGYSDEDIARLPDYSDSVRKRLRSLLRRAGIGLSSKALAVFNWFFDDRPVAKSSPIFYYYSRETRVWPRLCELGRIRIENRHVTRIVLRSHAIRGPPLPNTCESPPNPVFD